MGHMPGDFLRLYMCTSQQQLTIIFRGRGKRFPKTVREYYTMTFGRLARRGMWQWSTVLTEDKKGRYGGNGGGQLAILIAFR